MFETVQPENSSGSSKLVSVVVGVVVVLMVGFYFLFLRGEPATTPQAGTTAAGGAAAVGGEEPNALRDLSILKYNLGRDQTGTMALWDIQLSNRSRTYTYKNIEYATNYYSADGAVLYQNQSTISDELLPGDQKTLSGINDGLYPVGTNSFTIEIKGAESVLQ